ncbi:MAG: hypothetical protein IPM39_05265 [Chloroflexi bacterium]|nr:hypothetical protein [Chloroflexota bacterium]
MRIKRPFPLHRALFLLLTLFLFNGCQELSPIQDAVTGDVPHPTQAITPATVEQLTAAAVWGEGRAFDVVLDPSGQQLGVLTTVGLYVYNTADWRVTDFLPTAELVRSAVFAPDGRSLAVAGWQSSQISLWPLGGSPQALPANDRNEPIYQITFTPDGQLVSGSAAQVVGYMEPDASPTVLAAAPVNGRLGRISWAGADADWLLAVPVHTAEQSAVEIWPLLAAAPLVTLLSESGMALENGRLAADGVYYAAIVTDRTLQRDNALFIWQTAVPNVTYRRAVGGFITEDNWAMSPDGRLLAVTNQSGQVEIVQLDSGQTIASLALSVVPEDAAGLKVLFDGQTLIVAGPDGELRLWDASQNTAATAVAAGAPLNALRLNPAAGQFVTIGQNGLVEIRQLPDGRLVHSLAAHTQSAITDVAFAPDGLSLAASLSSGGVQIWDMAGGLRQTLGQTDGKVDSVAFSPDGRFLASGLGERIGPFAFDDTVTLWQMPEGVWRRSFAGEKEDVPACSFFRNSLAFSADGQFIASASHDFTVGLWQMSDGSLVHAFPPHNDAVLEVALSPDGRFLASASEDATIRVYQLSDYALVHQLTGSVGGFWSLDFSPDGRYLAAGDMLGNIYLWEAADGRLVRTFEGQKHKQSDLAFSPDGRLLAAGANGNEVQLWQVDNGRILASLPGHTGVVQRLAFAPDGQTLVTSGQDNALRLWQIHP